MDQANFCKPSVYVCMHACVVDLLEMDYVFLLILWRFQLVSYPTPLIPFLFYHVYDIKALEAYYKQTYISQCQA